MVIKIGSSGDDDAVALLDVAEADRRLRGLDADRADVALASRLHGLPHRPVEQVRHADDVVRRERSDDHVGLSTVQDGGGQSDRGGRVTGLGLEEDVLVEARVGREEEEHVHAVLLG